MERSFVSKANIHINDIKYDLLKIAEPHDGYMTPELSSTDDLIVKLFKAYLADLRLQGYIHSYDVPSVAFKETSATYDVVVQITRDRTPKRIKIHVGFYQSPWPSLALRLKAA